MSLVSAVYGQNTGRKYEYDDAGNRIVRHVITIPNKSSSGHKSIGSESDTIIDNFYTDKLGDISLKIFPNPTTSIITVQIDGMEDKIGGIIHLYDLSGAKIDEQRLSSHRVEIDMSSYPAGAYLATVLINGKTKYWKIVKQ
jgi:hypothetical protein